MLQDAACKLSDAQEQQKALDASLPALQELAGKEQALQQAVSDLQAQAGALKHQVRPWTMSGSQAAQQLVHATC